jgi:hypothetical protein
LSVRRRHASGLEKTILLPEWASHGAGDGTSPSFGVLFAPPLPSPFAQTNGGATTEPEKHTP